MCSFFSAHLRRSFSWKCSNKIFLLLNNKRTIIVLLLEKKKMKNQVNVHSPNNKNELVKNQPMPHNLNWSLGMFVNSWMRIIGIDPNIPRKNNWRWFAWFIQRWTCFLLSVGVNIFLMYFFYQMVKANTKTSSTLLWNLWMDFGITMAHSVFTHLCLLIFVTPKWKYLNIAMNNIEYSFIDSPSVYNRVRKSAPFAIIVVIFMVGY